MDAFTKLCFAGLMIFAENLGAHPGEITMCAMEQDIELHDFFPYAFK